MAQLANTPRNETHLRLEARKSFSFALKVEDGNSRPVDISGARLQFTARKSVDQPNLIANAAAEIGAAANVGYARFNLQASDLDHPAGEYPFAITIVKAGYSAVLVRGTLELLENPDNTGLEDFYSAANPAAQLDITLQGQVITVRTGDVRAPDEDVFTTADRAKFTRIEDDAQRNVQADWNAAPSSDAFIRNRPLDRLVPVPAAPGEILTSTRGGFSWSQPVGGDGRGYADVEDPDDPGFFIPHDYSGLPLPADDVAAGAVPTATGEGSWSWKPNDPPVRSVNGAGGDVVLTTDDIPETANRVMMTAAEREKLRDVEPLNRVPWDGVTNKPAFGSAALLDASQVLRAGSADASDVATGVLDAERVPRVSELRGFSHGTALPTGGSDGDLYLQHG